MAMIIYEKSGEFDPAAYGLGIGDAVQVICVGGGQAGGVAYQDEAYSPPADGGMSSFGAHVSSESGAIMGKGGESGKSDSYAYLYPGAGAGGYLPGLPVFGGHGSDFYIGGEVYPVLGLAGCASKAQATVSPYCNPKGDGNKGARCYVVEEPSGNEKAVEDFPSGRSLASGNGYGAGSSGVSVQADNDYGFDLSGGNAGKLSIGAHILTTLDKITVTVGSGGLNVASIDIYNGTRKFCTKGADGVVIVTW